MNIFNGAYFSFLLILLSTFSILIKGFNLGIEFSGGVEINLASKDYLSAEKVEILLKDIKFSKIKNYGSDKEIQIKVKSLNLDIDELRGSIIKLLPENVSVERIDYIGPELNYLIIRDSFIAIFISLCIMFFYLFFRFDAKIAFSSLLTLFHDIFILLGFISLMNIELDLIILSSIFTIFGYSVNDTIVIFDRIRDYTRFKPVSNFPSLLKAAIKSTYSRTLITSFTTIIVVFIIFYFLEGQMLWFCITLFFGIVLGTYSSIFISTSLFIFFKVK